MDASTAELTVRMIVGLAVVAGLLVVATRVARSRVGRPGLVDLEICGRQALTKSASIAIVRVGGRQVLLGVTDTTVTMLTEGDDLLVSPGGSDDSSQGSDRPKTVVDVRTGVLNGIRDRTVRRS